MTSMVPMPHPASAICCLWPGRCSIMPLLRMALLQLHSVVQPSPWEIEASTFLVLVARAEAACSRCCCVESGILYPAERPVALLDVTDAAVLELRNEWLAMMDDRDELRPRGKRVEGYQARLSPAQKQTLEQVLAQGNSLADAGSAGLQVSMGCLLCPTSPSCHHLQAPTDAAVSQSI